jgi:hypothetical protein
MKFGIQTNAAGAVDQVEVDMHLAGEALAHGAKHPLAYLDSKVAVAPGMPSARQQVYMQMGLNRNDITLKDAFDARAAIQAGPTTQDGSITGRMVTMAYLFDAIESKLRTGDAGILMLFNSKAAAVDSISGTKFDRPIINMSRPEAARSRPIAQLAEPTMMMTLTVSDNSYKIPATSIGIEYSDQAAASVSLPIVTLSITRQAEVEAIERVNRYLLSFLNGDTDFGMAALATVPGAVKNAKTDYDSSLTAGNLSQKAWAGWLFNGSNTRRIDTIITDFNTALAIENRSGRPTVMSDNPTSRRIDVGMQVLNPTWPDQVNVIISNDPAWPASTIVGFDSRYGYHVVNSTTLSYEGMESFAIRRSTQMRFDSGSVAYRLYDSAWSVLTLT